MGILLLFRSMQFKASKFNYAKSILLSVCEKKVFHLYLKWTLCCYFDTLKRLFCLTGHGHLRQMPQN